MLVLANGERRRHTFRGGDALGSNSSTDFPDGMMKRQSYPRFGPKALNLWHWIADDAEISAFARS